MRMNHVVSAVVGADRRPLDTRSGNGVRRVRECSADRYLSTSSRGASRTRILLSRGYSWWIRASGAAAGVGCSLGGGAGRARAAASAAAGAAVLDNTMCPVLTDEAVDPGIFVDYQGKRVYFCCKKCQSQFNDNPQKFLANLPQFAGAAMAAAVTAAVEPEHEAQAEEAEGGSLPERLLRLAGKFHVVVVHFPIALLLAAALAELLVWRGRASLVPVVRFCLFLGALSAVVAAPLGWIAAASEDWSGPFAETLFYHRWLGTTTAVLSVAALIVYELELRRRHATLRLWGRLLVFLVAGLVGLAGHFGGLLVNGLNYYSF